MLHFNKSTGPRPSKRAMQEASTLARSGTGDHMAVAMTLRPNGATMKEVITLLGKPHRNKIRQLVSSKQVKKRILQDNTRSQRVKLHVVK